MIEDDYNPHPFVVRTHIEENVTVFMRRAGCDFLYYWYENHDESLIECIAAARLDAFENWEPMTTPYDWTKSRPLQIHMKGPLEKGEIARGHNPHPVTSEDIAFDAILREFMGNA